MATVKSGKFWVGVIVGLVLCWVYQNKMHGKMG